MRKFLFILIAVTGILSCNSRKNNDIDVSSIPVDFTVKRFDIDFYTADSSTLPKIKSKYPLLFPPQPDSIWLQKINDSDERELFAETQKIYKDFSQQKEELTLLFKHIKHYNNSFKEPNVITMLTNVDYDNRVVYADSLLLISIDAYLGTNHPFYEDYPFYIKENLDKEHLIVDVASAIINQEVLPNTKRTFIDKMIYEGKKMYVMDLFLPSVSDKEKAGYSTEKYNWILHNEEEVWRYFIDKELLYSTDTKLNRRFLDLAPFSKFYTEYDRLSPGSVGVWVGWQIVRSYMRNNDVSLPELLKADEDEIFKKSKYKPKR